MMKDPSEVAEKWARRLKASTEDMRKGIEAVSEAPTKKAAEKLDKLLNNLTEAITSGKMASALEKVTLDEWKSAFLNKGIGRVAAGVDGSTDKMTEFMKQLLPAIESAKKKIEGMPDTTLEDRINRMNTYIREMSKFHKK